MKKWLKTPLLFFIIIWAFVFSVNSVQSETQEPVKGWPRLYENRGDKVIVHQPQLDDWEDYTLLSGKTAVAVRLNNTDREYYGAMKIQTSTETDFESRTVLLKDFKVTSLTFPNIDDRLAEKCREAVLGALPKSKLITISLDRVLAGLDRTKKLAKTVAVNLEPPQIFRSEEPAVLVLFMGEPKFETVEGASELLYGVNTNWDIILEVGSSQYYMLNGESWLVTGDIIKGPWKATGKLPQSFAKLPDDNNWKAVRKNIPGKKSQKPPRVFVSNEPAELIVTDGTPGYSPISGTKLLYVTNTDSDLFLNSGDSHFYFLTAGRWFKAKSLDGPWSAASEDLPGDFLKIPTDHKKAHVLSSIPGTPEAEAAVLLASVPRKATVDRKSTTVKVIYEGEPQFVVIKETTSTVYYAVNSPYSVFRVDKEYYCVYNGVWFVSSSAFGPWIVCATVPQVIYTIPATHPKHNVTYVYVYDSTPDTVIVGYTSGYSGTYVVATGVVMFGLGYWWGHELADDHYHHYHHYHYHSHYYAYGSAARYDYYHGGYYHSARYYGPHGGAGGWAGYDPASGTYYRGGFANGPYGSAFAREAYNPYTNRYAAQAGAKTTYGSWGRTVVAEGDNWARAGHRSNEGRTVGGLETSEGAKAIGGYNKWTDQGAVVGKDKHGDVYVGGDGNIYKREDNGWKKNSGEGWQSVDTSAAKSSAQSRAESARSKASAGDWKRPDSSPSRPNDRGSGISSQASSFKKQTNNLNREVNKRQTGNFRANTYQQGSSRGGGRSFRRR